MVETIHSDSGKPGAAASNGQVLADRAGALVATVNDLIADIESDLSAPSNAAFHAKDAYAALNRAHSALLEAIAEARICHYTGLARDAQKAAA